MPTVPKDHWESLQGTIEDLKTLSELHEDSSIANMAKKLYQLIDANIQVIEGKEVFYIACFEMTRLFSTDKRTDVWSRDFMIWRIKFGLWPGLDSGKKGSGPIMSNF